MIIVQRKCIDVNNVSHYLFAKENVWFQYGSNGMLYELFGCPTWFSEYIDFINDRINHDEYDIYLKEYKEKEF